MQDPSLYSQIKAQVQPQPQFPEQEHLKCPRCDSPNTKFCYYNNYNLSQPRHFCKSCKRYWTKGGALRNIPVGGGSRKNTKRSSSASTSSSTTSAAAAASSSSTNTHQSKRPTASASNNNNHNSNNNSAAAISESLALKGERYVGHFGNLMEVSGSFSSLLGSSGVQFGNFLDGLGTNGSSLQLSEHFGGPDPSGSVSGHTLDPPIGLDRGNSNNADGFLNIQGGGGGGGGAADSACWNGGNGWPDLAIYTPGTNFQ